MKLVANIQLLPTPEQATLLKETLERCNAACNWIADQAWQTKTFRQFALQKLTYGTIRTQFGLTAQAAVRCVAKVADAYKLDRKTQRTFRKHAGQPYDDRIFRFRSDTAVSIWTLTGRETIAYLCGEHQRKLLKFRKGEVDLLFIRGKWYISCVCDVDEPEVIKTADVLGIDLGIVNLAVSSTGTVYSGKRVEVQRRRFAHRRRNLQRKRTRSATRKLRKISGKQARFQADTNHCLSKAIVADAERSGCAIALEDLRGIRGRVKAQRRQRARLHNWGFGQLQAFIAYKAQLRGVPVVFVDPRYTSQTCPACGHIAKANRPDQATFQCVACCLAGPADHIAALNISARAIVMLPMVANCDLHNSATSPAL